jgi:hypothetical protein
MAFILLSYCCIFTSTMQEDKGMLGQLSKTIELEIEHEVRIGDLIKLYQAIKEGFRLPILTMETIFHIIFVQKMSLTHKVIEIAKLLILYNKKELSLRVINNAQQTICEIVSHVDVCRLNCIRVLHYCSDHTHGLTQMILV